MSLVTNTRNHTRNKITASAESGIDKGVRRDITEITEKEVGRKRTRT